MSQSTWVATLRQKMAERTDSEHGQAGMRLAIVGVVLAYFFSGFFVEYVGDASRVMQARWLISISLATSMVIFAHILVRPSKSVVRRLTGMVHDVTAISAALYVSEGAGAAIAVTYLWITVGYGFRYGMPYLYGCALFSTVGFIIVYMTNPFWQDHGTLSLNIVLTLAVVPPYVGSLLKSLHAAKDQLQKRASTDSLTGLLSRAEIEMCANDLFSHEPSNHVMLFCDLDRFKQVNDVAGHAAGDKLLADVAQIIRSCTRSNDFVGRLGGDEFCVLLCNTSLDTGRKVAEKIRSATAGYRLAWGTDYYSVGVSIGVAPSDAVKDSESLFRLADAGCYAAKNAGRNKIHVIDPRLDSTDTQTIRTLFDDGSASRATLRR